MKLGQMQERVYNGQVNRIIYYMCVVSNWIPSWVLQLVGLTEEDFVYNRYIFFSGCRVYPYHHILSGICEQKSWELLLYLISCGTTWLLSFPTSEHYNPDFGVSGALDSTGSHIVINYPVSLPAVFLPYTFWTVLPPSFSSHTI